MSSPPTLPVAVLIERRRQPSVWEDWGFRIRDVCPDLPPTGSTHAARPAPRVLADDGRSTQFLHTGLLASLHRDEAEGYHLNLTSGQPAWFVMWRVAHDDASRAWPESVTLSYNEAARLMDAQERVDTVPLAPELQDWLAAFTTEHYKPEPKKRRRPASFQSPDRR